MNISASFLFITKQNYKILIFFLININILTIYVFSTKTTLFEQNLLKFYFIFQKSSEDFFRCSFYYVIDPHASIHANKNYLFIGLII